MQLVAPFVFFMAAAPAVLSCEGPCIVGVTQVWVSNYTARVSAVFNEVSEQIAQRIVPQHSADVPDYLRPIFAAYDDESYAGMEHAIFPSFFHGKCQQNGVNPPGCPNPDCPVVCGTPGSLVHFFSKLRFIAFNETRSLLQQITAPGSASYKQAERAIVNAAGGGGARRSMYARANEGEVKKALREIMESLPDELEQACGGNVEDAPDGLPGCSWENAMKEYILTWP